MSIIPRYSISLRGGILVEEESATGKWVQTDDIWPTIQDCHNKSKTAKNNGIAEGLALSLAILHDALQNIPESQPDQSMAIKQAIGLISSSPLVAKLFSERGWDADDIESLIALLEDEDWEDSNE